MSISWQHVDALNIVTTYLKLYHLITTQFAFLNQSMTGYHLEMARLLIDRDLPKAAYELQRCIATRQVAGFGTTPEIQQMLSRLKGITPSTDAEQQTFYQKMIAKYG